MARSVRDTKLDARSARLKLKPGARYFRSVGDGLALVYRRTTDGYGTWGARIRQPDGAYALRALGTADDYQDANGADVLTYFQAQDRARGLADDLKRAGGLIRTPITVAEAAETYLAWYRDNRKAAKETESAIRAHILPGLGDARVADLTAAQIRAWHGKLAAKPARVRSGRLARTPKHREAPKTQDEKRARRVTANRILTILKALLNKAFHDGLVSDDIAWRQAKPFRKVDEARIRFLTDAEAGRLVNASPLDLRALVQAALVTGARYGELVGLHVRDVHLAKGQARIYIAESKSGKPRHVPLNSEGLALFKAAITGKTGEDLVFTKADGSAWGKNHHVKPLIAACRVATVKPAVRFHELRHTYASHLAQAGVDLLTISKLLGHADTRITAKHYAHLVDKTLAIAVAKLPSFGASSTATVSMTPIAGKKSAAA